jgi:superfamily I DNA/RNA helicase
MAELASALPAAQRYDSVVVDEAQDFAESWWPALLAALRDDEHGGMYAFTDDGQRVFPRYGRPPVSLVPLVLDHNLRNTRQIADTFMPLTPMPMQLLGGDGPAVRLVACTTADAVGRADDEVEALLADGWRPQDVALLTTGSRHPEQTARQAAGQDAYWRTFWDDDQVFYGHVLGFKGMERRAVVLALNESRPRERSRERLYVGLSRARDQLVVVGDPDHIRAVGGEDVLAGIRRTGND